MQQCQWCLSILDCTAQHVSLYGMLVCTAVPVVSQHPQITRRHCRSSVSHLCWHEHHNTVVLYKAHRLFLIHTGMLASSAAGKLQLHCLSRLNLFIPGVYTFTYLSSSIIFMADMSSSSHPCCSFECMWTHQYTGIHRAFQGVHGSREPGCAKHR